MLELYRLIDWLLQLPAELELAFRTEVVNYEQDKVMPYITSIERIGREEGRQEGRQEGRREGLQEGILAALEARFGQLPESLREAVLANRDEAHLQRLFRQAVLAPSLTSFEAQL